MPQTQSPCGAMWSNPFIVHEFFCARKWGTPLRVRSEQTRIASIAACNCPLRSRLGIFRGVVTIMQQFDCNPQFGLRKVCCCKARKIISFRVSQSDAPAETLFAAPSCDARCLFAPRGSKPVRLPPSPRWRGCDRRQQSLPRPCGSRSACANASIY